MSKNAKRNQHAKNKRIAPFEHLLDPQEEPGSTRFFDQAGFIRHSGGNGCRKETCQQDESNAY